MKYAVIGLGAVGSIVGGLLYKAGENVILIGKKNQVAAIKKNGLKIKGINGSIIVNNVNVSSDLSLVADCDVIIICVKSQDTQILADSLKGKIKKSALILSLQNGVRNSDILKNTIGNKTISGVVSFNAFYSEPGLVFLTMKGGLLLEYDKDFSDLIDVLLNSFKKAGLESKIVEGIQGFLWNKLIVNLQNAVTALTGQTIKESIIDKDSRAILVATMKEGINILENSGVQIETVPGFDSKKMISRLSLFNSTMLKLGSRFMDLKENARTSMWQSLHRRKLTEIEYINGEIVKLAEKNNLKAPINSKLVELIKEAERNHLVKNFEPFELKKILCIDR